MIAEHELNLAEQPLAQLVDITKVFSTGRGDVFACDNVNLTIHKGTSLGLVGESGSGKSTLVKILQLLHRPTSGRVLLNNVDVTRMSERQLRKYRRQIQFVAQDPFGSLFPHLTVSENIMEPLYIHKVESRREQEVRALQLMERVGLPRSCFHSMPHELSGGQQQRVAIARALALSPTMLILDEAVASLDVSIQAQILNLLLSLKDELNLTQIFISHNLAVVRLMCEETAVMFRGRIVERGDSDIIFHHPMHPYTKLLIAAIPAFTKDGVTPLPNEAVLKENRRLADEIAKTKRAKLQEVEPGHFVAIAED